VEGGALVFKGKKKIGRGNVVAIREGGESCRGNRGEEDGRDFKAFGASFGRRGDDGGRLTSELVKR